MSKINWKVRFQHKTFWVALVGATLLFAQTVLRLFGIEMDTTSIEMNINNLISAVFVILSVFGIVADPTTEGVHDSDLALSYEIPKDDHMAETFEALADFYLEDVSPEPQEEE